MESIISFINSLAPVILVLLGLGIIFRVVKLKSVGFFLLFLLLLPFMGSAISQFFSSATSGGVSWKLLLVGGLIILIAIRLFLDRVFGRR